MDGFFILRNEGRPMHEVTCILAAIEQGDPQAAEQLLPLVYDELRRLAAERITREKPGQRKRR
jgi:DNA-binding GntR family transcriptional regulator